jgi:putative NADH-flavin reductase
MKIVVFGASGRTGALIVDQALDAGHQVVAYVRRESALGKTHPNLKSLVGELNSTTQLHAALKGADVCISALGGGSLRKHASNIINGIDHIVKVAEKEDVKRFIYLSSLGVGESRYKMPQPLRFVIADLLLRVPLADHAVNEARITASKLNWTIVRPGGLNDGKLVNQLKYGTGNELLKGSASISRASVAAFMLAQIDNPSFEKQAVWLCE